MPSEPFDLHVFNSLPRPDIEAALVTCTPESLGLIFRYLFKPNRAVAWADDPARFPLDDHNLRWLFRLPTPPACDGNLLAAVGTDGVLSLWCYRLVNEHDPDAGGGLFPLSLNPDTERSSTDSRFLRLTAISSAYESSSGFFYLERVLCAADREGGIRIRLLTPSGEHHINLDLGTSDPSHANGSLPISFSHQLRPVTDQSVHDLRQVGGWTTDNQAFYWNTSAGPAAGELFSGSRNVRQPYQLQAQRPGLPIRAAAAEGDWIAVGGDDKRLWIGRCKDSELTRSPNEKPLLGHVRSLAMIPQVHSQAPFILAGCDDHFLHVLDERHQSLQKVDLGGVPEAILPLARDRGGAWYDLAILVRDRGLICLRLLRDRFHDHSGPDNEGDRDKHDQQELLDRLVHLVEADPRLLRSWLTASSSREQLLGLGLLLYRRGTPWDGFDLNRDLPLTHIGHEVIDFAAHTIKEQVELLALGKVNADSPDLSRYLDVLEHFAEGPYRARLAVRRLEGWLATLRERFRTQPELLERAVKLTDALPDAKRLLRKHAEQAATYLQHHRQAEAEKELGALVALTERLRFDRLFNEIILAPVQTSGRVDAVTIVKDGRGVGLQVFGRRGESRLGSFRNEFSTARIRPIETTRPWPCVTEQDGVSDIRALAPLGPDLLLVVSEDRVRLITSPNAQPPNEPEYRLLVDASQSPANELHSAAVCAIDGGGYRVAIGIEWLPNATHAVILLHLDSLGNLVKRDYLPAPAWNRRVRITALDWDEQGRLWAATGGPGYLIYWGNRVDEHWVVSDVLVVGSPQYALKVIGVEQILLGGADGVVRAFDPRGSLQWARILPGAIVGIGTREPTPRAELRFAPISVITERGTIALYDEQGRHLGILELPRDHLTALASGTVARAEIQHHLVGTLRGEVRLLEEVPTQLSKAPLGFIAAQLADAEHQAYWDAVRSVVEAQVQRLEEDYDLCRRWTELSAASEEPLRACWAARCLLRNHGDFDSVLTLLEQFPPPLDAPTRELPAHVFGALGESLANLPVPLEHRLIALCRGTWDGALASLITHTPDAPGRIHLWQKVLDVAREKVLEGYPFVSSAVLQRIQRHPDESASPRDWLTLLLDQTARGNHGIHRGFVQGLIGIVLRQIGYADDGVLYAFARPAETGAALVEALRTNTPAQKALLDLLDGNSDVLLRQLDHCAWRAVAADLRANTEVLFGRLHAAVGKASERCSNAPDLTMLRRHLALFPGGTPEEQTHWRADALTELRRLTDDLRVQLHRVHILAMPVDESLVQLEKMDVQILSAPSPSPLVVNVHAAWQRLWMDEVQRERDHITGPQEVERDLPAAPEAIAQVFRVMHEAGFRYGRYYRVHYLPGHGGKGLPDFLGLLEMRNHTGGLQPDLQYSRFHPLDGALAVRVREYTRDAKDIPGPDILIYRQRPADPPQPLDSGLRYWQTFWHQDTPAPVFEIPVLRRSEQGFRAAGLFVFDLPADQDLTPAFATTDERTTPLIRDALRPALRKVINMIKAEEQDQAFVAAKRFSKLENEMLTLFGSDAMQLALLRAAVDVAGAEDGLLVVRSSVNGLFTVRGATPESHELFKGVKLRPNDDLIPAVNVLINRQPLLIPCFDAHPDADRIRVQLAERFAAADKPGLDQQWLGKFGSALVLEGELDNKPHFAISLRHSKPYHFFEHHLTAVQTLIRRYRGYFKALQLYEERRHFINAFVHDIRSDLLLVKQPLEMLRNAPTHGNYCPDTAEHLDMAMQHVRKLYNRSQNVLDTGRAHGHPATKSTFKGPGAILKQLLSPYRTSAENFTRLFVIQPADFDVPVWHLELCGKGSVFEQVLGNLIDNAVKYGRDDIRIEASASADEWQFVISNPGHMTPEENELKFQPNIKPAIPRFEGLHVALAASLGLAQAIGGNLELENMEVSETGPRVVAVLKWPISKSGGNHA